jgi:hypothetical protein
VVPGTQRAAQKNMKLRRTLLSIGLLALCPGFAAAQVAANVDPGQPDFRIIVQGTFDPETLAEFNRRVSAYAALRAKLEKGLPPLVVTTDADQIERFEHRLARRLRDARSSRRGQIFAPAMQRQVKQMLTRRADAATIALIMDDSPREFDVDVNDTYSKRHALATMPPNILLVLPDLPPDMEYRFVGRHLILRDVRANMIIDEVPHALQCKDCVPVGDHHDDDDADPVMIPKDAGL